MPYVEVWVETDDLIDELDDDDLIEKLQSRGYSCFKDAFADRGEFGIVEHLSVCGLVDEARAEALKIVSKAIGRSL
jgi:hypothetical protein